MPLFVGPISDATDTVTTTTTSAPPPPPTTTSAPAPAPASQPIPQAGTPLVDTDTNVFIPAPTATGSTASAPAPSSGSVTVAPITAPTATGPLIPVAGHPYVDLGDVLGPLDEILAPPVSSGGGAVEVLPGPTDTGDGDPLAGWTFDDPDALGFFSVSNPPLKGYEWLSAMVDLADLYRLDPQAVAADVLNEGANGAIGDGGLAYGPFQDHLTEFSGRPFYGHPPLRNNKTANAWAWTRNGLDYSLRLIAFGEAHARGLKGAAAVAAIVRHYEKPDDIPGQISVRTATWRNLQSMGASWVQYVAGRMVGPAGGGAVDRTPVTGGKAAPSTTPKPSKQWAATLHFFANDVPAAGANARAGGNRADDAVRSVLWRAHTG